MSDTGGAQAGDQERRGRAQARDRFGRNGGAAQAASLGKPAGPPAQPEHHLFRPPKGELRKAGYSLRVRAKSGERVQTVKHRGGDTGGFSSRPEWESRIDGDALDFEALKATPVGEILSQRDMKKRLQPVSETRVTRRPGT
jgi:inorganic triphosphatase YgiF